MKDLGGNFKIEQGGSIKVITFDFWDVFAELDHPMYDYMKKHGIEPEKFSKQLHDFIIEHDLGKLTEQEFLKEASKVIGLELPYDVCRLVFKKELMNPNLVEIANKLKEKYKLILLTNNSREYCEEYLFKTKLNELFSDLIISYEVGLRKPSQEIYELLIQKSGAKPEEILFVDDDASKFPNAEAMGINTLQYKRGETDEILKALTST